MFENNGHIHVYSPGARADNPLGSNFFQKYKSSINLVICCKFFPFNYFVTVFSNSNTQATTFDLVRSRSTLGHDLYKLCRT